MKLTLKKSDLIDDWYVIERAEHDGREWLETIGPDAHELRCSARFSDADVEGYGTELLAVAAAIEQRGAVRFKRCAVHVALQRSSGVAYEYEANRRLITHHQFIKAPAPPVVGDAKGEGEANG